MGWPVYCIRSLKTIVPLSLLCRPHLWDTFARETEMAFAVLLCLVHLLNLVEFFSACKGCLLTEATPPKKRGKVTVYIYVPYSREAFSFFFCLFGLFLVPHVLV